MTDCGLPPDAAAVTHSKGSVFVYSVYFFSSLSLSQLKYVKDAAEEEVIKRHISFDCESL